MNIALNKPLISGFFIDRLSGSVGAFIEVELIAGEPTAMNLKIFKLTKFLF